MSSPRHAKAHHKGYHRRPGKTKQYAAYAGTTAAAGVIALSAAPAASASQGGSVPSAAAADVTDVHLALARAQNLAQEHLDHVRHVEHLEHVLAVRQRQAAAQWAREHPPAVVTAYSVQRGGHPGGGTLSYGELENLWEQAGGPASAAPEMATIAIRCESGGRQYAHNPSGASGYWQILGQVVGGNVYDPMVNAENAVAKFKAGGFSPWAGDGCV